MSYIEKKVEILGKIARNEEFTVDTNVIVKAAQNNDAEFLEKVILYQNCTVTNTFLNELKGLMRGGMFNGKQITWLENFILAFRNRIINVPVEERIKIEEELNELVPLVPRTVANHVILGVMDELIKMSKELLPKARNLTDKDRKKFLKEYADEVKTLKTKCEDRYLQLSENYIYFPPPVENNYMKAVMNFVDAALNKIGRIVVDSRGDLNYIIAEINKIRRKTYDDDVRIVAESIIKGIETVSDDSDVIWLFTLYGLRHAA